MPQRLGPAALEEEDTTDAGEVNPHLVASKNIDRVYWHVLITTSAMEF